MPKLIIDTDPGIDDAQAIAFAVAHPELELLGLTTVFGNVSVELATKNALIIAEKLGVPDLPVAQGEGVPLVQPRIPAPDFVHGSDGLGNLHLAASSRSALEVSAAEYIIDAANRFPGEICLVAVGPLTNVAKALELDPTLPSKLKELVVMGGTVDEPGNVSPVAEANFMNDPHAADRVLAVNWPATLIGLDVTHRILLADTHLAELRDRGGDVGRFLWDSSRFYVNFYSSKGAAVEEVEPSCAMHDATAVVYLLERDAFTCASGAGRVVEDGVAAGQLIVDRKGYAYDLPHWRDRPACYAAMTVDAERVRRHFLDTLVTS